jgi:glycosyltransferase involved in cell wall biosynthesis
MSNRDDVKLIHLADYGGPYAGSFIPMLRAVMGAARGCGWQVEAIFSEVARGRPWLADLEVDAIPYRFMSVDAHDPVAGAMGEGGTVLHCHFSHFDIACARLARSRRDTIAFWHVHSPLQLGAKAWARNAVRFRFLSRGVTAMLCVAPDIQRAVLRRWAPRDRVELFPNAIDTGRFAAIDAARRAEARARLGLSEDQRVLLHFGWDWLRKGGDVYLDAVRRLTERHRDGPLVAITVGGGEPARELATASGLSGVVRVLPTTNEVDELYAAADLLISPSRAEGMPFSVAEALAAGTAVVATPLLGHRYLGDRLDACRIVPLDAEQLADAIDAQLRRDPVLAAREAADARAWILREMDLQAWAARLVDRYRAAL